MTNKIPQCTNFSPYFPKNVFFERLLIILKSYFDGNFSLFQLIYSLNTGRDYGTILCWAENKLGNQLEPCVFHLIPAGKVNNIVSKQYHPDDFQTMMHSVVSIDLLSNGF